jgi:hypothetical protein
MQQVYILGFAFLVAQYSGFLVYQRIYCTVMHSGQLTYSSLSTLHADLPSPFHNSFVGGAMFPCPCAPVTKENESEPDQSVQFWINQCRTTEGSREPVSNGKACGGLKNLVQGRVHSTTQLLQHAYTGSRCSPLKIKEKDAACCDNG